MAGLPAIGSSRPCAGSRRGARIYAGYSSNQAAMMTRRTRQPAGRAAVNRSLASGSCFDRRHPFGAGDVAARVASGLSTRRAFTARPARRAERRRRPIRSVNSASPFFVPEDLGDHDEAPLRILVLIGSVSAHRMIGAIPSTRLRPRCGFCKALAAELARSVGQLSSGGSPSMLRGNGSDRRDPKSAFDGPPRRSARSRRSHGFLASGALRPSWAMPRGCGGYTLMVKKLEIGVRWWFVLGRDRPKMEAIKRNSLNAWRQLALPTINAT